MIAIRIIAIESAFVGKLISSKYDNFW